MAYMTTIRRTNRVSEIAAKEHTVKKKSKAKKYDEVSIHEVIAKNLQVVDMTASILARDNKMPMWVFGLNEKDSIVNTVKGDFTGTKVTV